MKNTKKQWVVGFCGLGVWLIASSALAQGVTSLPTEGAGKSGDYGYKFDDDPLSAGGFGPSDQQIKVRPGPIRTTLIRPRTSFVPEMLKSVENI